LKRFPAFDPPEYVQWKADPELVDAFEATIHQDAERESIIEGLTRADHERFYSGLVRNRLHDITLKRWVKTGVITKAWLGTGEEAVTIGSVHALEPRDVVAPMIRNAGACHEKGMPLADLFRGYLATEDSPTRGRDLHVGDLRHGIITPISHVAAVVPVTVGAALGFKLRHEARVAMTWVGDGSTKVGDFHEGANMAAVMKVPVVLVIQNNGVALGTRLEQNHAGRFELYAPMYGMAGGTFDGNHILDAYAASLLAVRRAREGRGPSLLVAETFRMGGHATHDEREARETFPAHLFAYWGKRDPIGLYEAWLIRRGIYSADELADLEARVQAEIDAAEADALKSRHTHPADPERVAEGVYAEAG